MALFGEGVNLQSSDVPHLICALCRGRSGLPLGRLFKGLQSRQQGMDISKFHSTYSLPAFPPYSWVCKADGQFERGESLLSPTSCSLCLPAMGPSSSTRAPPIPPPSAPPAVQQQCDRSCRGSPESGAVSRPDLPGGTAAHPPAGRAGLHLRRAAAALSVQLGWACQVSTLQHSSLPVLQVHASLSFEYLPQMLAKKCSSSSSLLVLAGLPRMYASFWKSTLYDVTKSTDSLFFSMWPQT